MIVPRLNAAASLFAAITFGGAAWRQVGEDGLACAIAMCCAFLSCVAFTYDMARLVRR